MTATIPTHTPATIALEALTREAAAWRAAYEDGRNDGGYDAGIEAAFEAAWDAGATREEAEHAYQLGVDWGYAAEFAQ